jgi:PPOX class probable F420-dependent enzyme
VSVVWIGLDGDDLVSGHMQWYAKLRNIERDPRVVLSFVAPRVPGAFLNPYAVLHARAAIEPGDDAWNLLDRLTKVYMSPDTGFPAPKGPGYLVRYSVERIGGVGPWVPASR